LAEPLLEGAVDLHIHTAPDIFERNVDAISAARAAKDAGMRAIVVKSHSTDTSARAQTAREITGFPVFGGIVLNYPVGGLNEFAVRESVKQGGRIVWLPTIGARHFMANASGGGMLQAAIPPGVTGLTALDDAGQVLPEILTIIDLVVENDLALASGHLEEQETLAVFTEAVRRGASRLIVTHPHVPFVGMQRPNMKALADLGAYIEITDHEPLEKRLAVIEEVGPERVFLSTDGGTVAEPTPVERLTRFVRGLSAAGVSDADVHRMAATNPAHLLRLDEAPAGEGGR
jgi:uncharacterized protein DUF6282